MPVHERRRVALRQVVVAAWGEEAADTLFDLVAPSGHDVATAQDIGELRRWADARFASQDEHIDARFAVQDERIDARFAALDERLEGLEHRLSATFERRIADAVTAQTRTLVVSQLGAVVAIAALAFGLR